MSLSPFHAALKAQKLSKYAYGGNDIVSAFASADIEIYPYQVGAAAFALRSPYLKGAILADETGLGKSIETLLVVAQKWYEGKERILLIVPSHLIYQWQKELENKFSLPYCLLDRQPDNAVDNPFIQNAVVLATYDIATDNLSMLDAVHWDLAVFEEAHRLRKHFYDDNKKMEQLRVAIHTDFKLLVTATPMQNSLMDIYGLINFIDDSIFPDAELFCDRYVGKPEHLPELCDITSKFFYRTLRNQVKQYVQNPERVLLTAEYELSPPEKEIYKRLEKYLAKDEKKAFPKMDRYELTLMLTKLFSSSIPAIRHTLKGVAERLNKLGESKEHAEINYMVELCAGIQHSAKALKLIETVENGFKQLKTAKANRKALIFTENLQTQSFLEKFLSDKGYKIAIFNGSSDYRTIIDKFRDEFDILISTNLAAEGLCMEFCAFIINYDLPYNAQIMEQRIGRCHRNGQKHDVLVASFVDKDNFADIRLLELIHKRLRNFAGMFGASDNLIGFTETNRPQGSDPYYAVGFENDIGRILSTARTKKAIDKEFDTLQQNEAKELKEIGTGLTQNLFSSFDSKILDKLMLPSAMITDKKKELDDDLWELTEYYLGGKSNVAIDSDTKSVTLYHDTKFFTGWNPTGGDFSRKFSMTDKTVSKASRHTVTGTLARNILFILRQNQTDLYGDIVLKGNNERTGRMILYKVIVKQVRRYLNDSVYYALIGMDAQENVLDDAECRRIMDLPVLAWKTGSKTHGDIGKPVRLNFYDIDIDQIMEKTFDKYIDLTASDYSESVQEQIELAKAQAVQQKIALDRNITAYKTAVARAKQQNKNADNMQDKLKTKQETTSAEKRLKQAEQQIFMNKALIEKESSDKIHEITFELNFKAEYERIFTLNFRTTSECKAHTGRAQDKTQDKER